VTNRNPASAADSFLIAPGAKRPIIPHAMFHLTRRERLLIACLLLAFLTGLAVKHYRQGFEAGIKPPMEHRDAKR